MKNTCGVMVLSLDLELAWGRFDKLSATVLNAESLEERSHIKSLLALLDRYEIPATWAMVGHLMLDSCTRDQEGGQAHVEVSPTLDIPGLLVIGSVLTHVRKHLWLPVGMRRILWIG